MGSLLNDVRYALRSYRRSPGATLVVVLTLALGIGATTAIFTLVNGIMLGRLPVPNPSGLLILGNARACCVNGGIPEHYDIFSYRFYMQLREENPYFTDIAAVRARADNVSVRFPGRSGSPETLVSRLVSSNYFSVLGVAPVAGRGFAPGEDVGEGTHPVAVISDRMCRKYFAGSPNSALGSTFLANGIAFTVVGVMPPGFFGETVEVDPPDIWTPLSMQPTIMSRRALFDDEDAAWLYPIARLKDGAKLAEAQAWVKTKIQANLTHVEGATLTDKGRQDIARVEFHITSGEGGISKIRNGYGEAIKVLMALVTMLLLLCCANVSNILLARATGRKAEIATRVALGASRARIIRQVMTETAMVGIVGGGAGLALAYWGADLLSHMAFQKGYVPVSTVPDLRVLAFTAGLALLATVISGLGPAWHTARMSLNSTARTTTEEGGSRLSLGGVLVVAQVAVCLALVVTAGLFSRSLNATLEQDFGFDTRVLDVRIEPDKAGYKFQDLDRLYQQIVTRVEATNRAQVVTYAQYGPFSDNWNSTLSIPGYKSLDGDPPLSRWMRVGPRYAEAMGLKMLAGRDIGPQDTPEAGRVAVVNEEFVKRYLAGREPLGVQFSFTDAKNHEAFQIVGVVRSVKYQNAKEEITPTFYLPMLQKSGLAGTPEGFDDSMYAKDVLIRTSDHSQTATEAIRRAVEDVDSQLPIRYVRTIQEQVSETVRGDHTLQQLSALFGGLALVIASIGLYGLMMYGVSRRTREMGIRFALGASVGNVVTMIMQQSLRLVLIGIGVGLPLMWLSGRFAASLLYGIGPHDPAALIAATLVLVAVAAVAAYLPARRASQVDPAVVLRAE